ncbi:MAG: DNA polymerase III subunit [Elusimicrobia bacterium]|nr:DNA polymerase III subunit [Elusimicrobiota bacterium]
MSFEKILGHSRNIGRLKALLACGRVPPALLFSGAEGTGKFLVAKEFAKALNCLHKPAEDPAAEENLFASASPPPIPSTLYPLPSDDACDKCVSCLQIDSGAHPDVRIIDADFQGFLLDEAARKQKSLKIDTVREFTRYVYQKNMFSPWKVFIINDAHTLNLNAQNAMLKILEEPPGNAVFVLVAAKKNTLLPTIISRTYALNFKALGAADVEELLERSGLPLDEASALSELSGGSVKNAGDIKRVRDRLASVAVSGPARIFKLVSSLPKEPYMAREEAKIMLNMLILSARKKWLAEGRGQNAGRFAALIKKLLGLRKLLNSNVTHGLVLETALLESEKLSVSFQ